MLRLIVNPETPSAWEIRLQPGINRVGSDVCNEFPINHQSVAPFHCEVTVRDSMITVRDLGSTSGTLVDGALIGEVRLRSGQKLQLGEVLMQFETDEATEDAGPSPLTDAIRFCKNHQKAFGKYECPDCGEVFCDLCVSRRNERNIVRQFCRVCGTECAHVKRPGAPDAAPEKTFFQFLPGAFAYPFRGDGVILLIAGAVFYAFMRFIASHAFLVGVLVALFCTGYLISYYQSILSTSAGGQDSMPDWPDFSDLRSLLSPYLQFAATALVAFGPAIVISSMAPEAAPWKPAALGLVIVIGCLYFPMAFMAVALADSIAAVNPLVILPSILKIFGSYFVTAVLLAFTIGIMWIATDFLDRLSSIPILPALCSQFLGLYLTAVMMRILGVLYRCKKHDLRWFTG